MQYRAGIILSLFISHSVYAEVIPDGKTATTVQTLPNQKEVITIAPANNAGISHNQYQKFNVGTAGAELNNTKAGAKTIINEVTSLSKSYLNGAISVSGDAAHVIIANPNGIQVDGGEFINTKGTVLTTGQIKLLPGSAPNTQTLQLITHQGEIDIQGKGLVGTFEELDLIAKKIRINGQIQETSLSPRSAINLVAGDSVSTVAASALTAGPGSGWFSTQAGAAANGETAMIDISPLGNLRAGSLTLIVTEKGAGVSHQGTMLATSGDFVISSEGKVSVKNGLLSSAGNLVVMAKDDISNLGGKWIAGKNGTIHSDRNFNHSWQGNVHDAEVHTFSVKEGRSWGHRVTKKGVTVDYGMTEGNAPDIIAYGALHIEAKNIANDGGTFGTLSGDLTLKSETLKLNSFNSGNVQYTRKCGWFCSDSSSDNLSVHTANVFSGGKIIIESAQGGEFTSANIRGDQGVFMKIPSPILKDLVSISPLKYESMFFSSNNEHYSSLKSLSYGGVIHSNSGKIEIISEVPVANQGWHISGEQGEYFSSGQIDIAPQTLDLPSFSSHLGFGQSLLF